MAILDSESRNGDAVPHDVSDHSAVFAARVHANVLVIDDELLIVRSVTRTLSGHKVVAVTCAQDALVRFQAGDQFDLILCDLMMPGMDGMELFRTVQRDWPELVQRFVFMTGGAYSEASRVFMATVCPPHLEKPFSAEDIRAHVTAALLAR